MLRIAAITASGALLGLTMVAGCDQTEYDEPTVDENQTTPTYEDTQDTTPDDSMDDTIGDEEDRSVVAPPPEPETTLVGVLEQSTDESAQAGWVLTGTDAGDIEVDVTNVTQDLTALEGQRVLVTGELVERADIERGMIQVLVADRIEAA